MSKFFNVFQWTLAAVLLGAVPLDKLVEAQTPSAFPVAKGPESKFDAHINGAKVVWAQQAQSGNRSPVPHYDLYTKDIVTHMRTRVLGGSAVVDAIDHVSISGNRIVWTDCRLCHIVNGLPGYAGTRAYGEYLPDRRIFAISSLGGDQRSVEISGVRVVWIQYGSVGSTAVYAKNLVTQHVTLVAAGREMKSQPTVSGTTVVWNEYLNGGWDVLGRNLAAGREFVIARHNGPDSDLLYPQIDGPITAWVHRAYHARADTIEAENLKTHQHIYVVRLPPASSNQGYDSIFAISRSVVVWQQRASNSQSQSSSFAILGKDLETGKSFTVSDGKFDNEAPSISNRTVIWQRSERVAGKPATDIFGVALGATAGHREVPFLFNLSP